MAFHEQRLRIMMRRNEEAARLYPGEMVTMDELGRVVPLRASELSERDRRLATQARASRCVVRDAAAKLAHLFLGGSTNTQCIEIKDKIGQSVSDAALFAFRNEAIQKDTAVHTGYIIDCLKLLLHEMLSTTLSSQEMQTFGLDVALVFIRSVVAAEMAKLHALLD